MFDWVGDWFGRIGEDPMTNTFLQKTEEMIRRVTKQGLWERGKGTDHERGSSLPGVESPQQTYLRQNVLEPTSREARTEREAGAANTHQEFSSATCSKRPGMAESPLFFFFF